MTDQIETPVAENEAFIIDPYRATAAAGVVVATIFGARKLRSQLRIRKTLKTASKIADKDTTSVEQDPAQK